MHYHFMLEATTVKLPITQEHFRSLCARSGPLIELCDKKVLTDHA